MILFFVHFCVFWLFSAEVRNTSPVPLRNLLWCTEPEVPASRLCSAKVSHIANKGPVRIQYKCLVPIYFYFQPHYFQNRIIMPCLQFPHSCICARFKLYIPRIGLPILEHIFKKFLFFETFSSGCFFPWKCGKSTKRTNTFTL